MGPYYFLVTLNPLSRDEVRAFIVEQGGELESDFADGAIATRNGRLTVRWATDERVDSILQSDNFVNTRRGIRDRRREYESLARIAETLGGVPHDFVRLDLLSRAGSQHLAVPFVEAFARRWSPCVLDTREGLDTAEEGKDVWTMEDVFRLARMQRRLPTTRHDIRLDLDYYEAKRKAEEAEGLDD